MAKVDFMKVACKESYSTINNRSRKIKKIQQIWDSSCIHIKWTLQTLNDHQLL